MVRIRPYRPADLDSLYEICLRTGAAGHDATDLVEEPRLFGELFAAPYGVLEPEHAFVLDNDDSRAIGYVLGALDTASFEARCEAEWWPALREQHPLRPDSTRLDDLLIHLLHHRPVPPAPLLDRYPSHLHIDLLPEAQSGGWGRQMMGAVLDALRADGSPGVHWDVSSSNERAIGFYRHLGHVEVAVGPSIHTFATTL